MTRFFLIAILANLYINVQAQSIELTTLLNNSTEKRLDKSKGFGIMYSHTISKRSTFALAGTYKFRNSTFDNIEGSNADPRVRYFKEISSNTKSFSIRLNYQYAIINKEPVTLSLGPEVSYNFLWGKDKTIFSTSNNANQYSLYSKDIEQIRRFGLGILTRVQIHKIFIDRLSLCFDIRPELIFSPALDGIGDTAPFNGAYTNLEFMLGFQYRLK